MKLGEMKKIGAKIENGAWVTDLPNLPGVAVKARGFGNAEYRRLLMELRKDLTPDETNDLEVQESIATQLLADTIVLDWEGIENDDGTKVECTPAMVRKLVSDPDLQHLKAAFEQAGMTVAQRGQDKLEASTKN